MDAYRLSVRAERDIADIYAYSVETFGLTVAETYVLGLHAAFEMLGAHPRLGRAVDEIRPHLRRHVHRRHVIYYSLSDDGPFIERVLHASQDPGRHLSED